MSHPELQRALQPTASGGRSFWPMWSKSAVMCEGVDNWPPDTLDVEEEFTRYLSTLIDSMVCEPTKSETTTVWTIRTPRPETLGETHFIAICKANHEPWSYPGSPPSCRYFTLEETFDPQLAVFCEWTRDGEHKNLGAVPRQTNDGFTRLVLERLSAGA